MIQIGVLGSTKGSDLPVIVEDTEKGKLRGLAKIAVVISDKENSGILEKARRYEIKNFYLSSENLSRTDYDRKISEILNRENVELIALIGYMKLFSSWFVKKYENRIMNIHPSLLPSFPGINKEVHKSVLEYGCKISGCTLFFVEEGKDTGPIIMQKAVPVYDSDNVDNLKERVQKAEQEIYSEAIRLYSLGKLEIKGKRVLIK